MVEIPDRAALAAMFGDDYERFELPLLTLAGAETDVDDMLALVAPHRPRRLLDAPCGHGRHAVLLAARGIDVTGVELSDRFLALARRAATEANVDVALCRADLADLPFRGGFDMAVSWYGSFGYHGDEEDRRVLAGYRRALEPGGVLVLDLQSPYRMIPALVAGGGSKTEVQRVGDDVLFDTVTLDPMTSRYHGERVTIVGAGRTITRYSVRAFTVPEISAWLRASGFSEPTISGDGGQPLTVNSRRLRVVARRP